MGTSSRQTQGPSAGRYLAAHQYWNYCGKIPTHWDWDARSLDITAPHPLLFSLVREKTSVAVPETNAPCEKTSAAVTGPNAPCRPPPPVLDRPPRRPRGELHAAPVASKPSPPQPAPSASRHLSEFEVAETSPSRKRAIPRKGDGAPSRLEPRAWDGRNLATISQNNFIRGGYSPPPNRASRGKSGNSASSRKGIMHGKSKPAFTSNPYGKSKPKKLRAKPKISKNNVCLRAKPKIPKNKICVLRPPSYGKSTSK